MRRLTKFSAIALLAVASACSDRPAPTAAPLLKSAATASSGRAVTVMTRNLSIGADVFAVLTAPPNLVPIAVGIAYNQTVSSNPVARMKSVAAEIAAARPDLVGLQEVEKFMVQSRMAVAVIGGPTTVRQKLSEFVEQTGIDEVIFTSDLYEQADRLRSFELTAAAMKAAALSPVS